MYLVYSALAGLLAFFAVHVVLWRTCPRCRSIPTLVLISLLVAAALIGIARIWNIAALDCLLLAQFHVFVTFVYIAAYCSVEEQSPTLAILKLAHCASDRGITETDISSVINDDFIIERRLRPLLQGKFVENQGEQLVLTPKGKLLAWVYHVFRAGTGAKIGG